MKILRLAILRLAVTGCPVALDPDELATLAVSAKQRATFHTFTYPIKPAI